VKRSDVARLARHHGFGAITDQLAEIAEWGMRIERSRAVELAGRSRLGGRPDLEPSTPWPTASSTTGQAGQPMTFLAQVNLDDVAGIDWRGPREGLLSFFVARDLEGFIVWRDAAAVLHQSLSDATARDHPDGVADEGRPEPVCLTFRPELCLPSIASEPSRALVSIGMDTDRDAEKYFDFCHSLAEHQGLLSPRSGGAAIWETDRFAGHPGFLQSDPINDSAERASRSEASPRLDAADWKQLLQLTEFEEGEETGIYVCAPTDDDGWLFSHTQVIDQRS
jgi:hypothetical protein